MARLAPSRLRFEVDIEALERSTLVSGARIDEPAGWTTEVLQRKGEFDTSVFCQLGFKIWFENVCYGLTASGSRSCWRDPLQKEKGPQPRQMFG